MLVISFALLMLMRGNATNLEQTDKDSKESNASSR